MKNTNVIDYYDHNEQQRRSNDWEESYFMANNCHQEQYSNNRSSHIQYSDNLSQKTNRHYEQKNDRNRITQTLKTRSNGKNT